MTELVELIVAPMKGGKTSELRSLAERANRQKLRVLVANSAVDTRSGQGLVKTHTGLTTEALHVSRLCDELLPLLADGQIDVVMLDEIHFITDIDDLRKFVSKARRLVRRIHLFGLDTDRNQNVWPATFSVMSMVHQVRKLTAICERCQRLATTTIMQSAKPSDDIVHVGDNEYEAVCQTCAEASHACDALAHLWNE